MKIFWSFLFLAVLAAGVYFWISSDSGTGIRSGAKSAYQTFLEKLAALDNLRKKGGDILQSVNNAAGTAESGINGIKNFLDAAPGTVSSTIFGLYDKIKSQLPPSAVKLISGEPLQGYIFPGGQFSLATSTSLQGDVCVEFRNDMSVDYSIRNPFSPAKDYNYHIDWGDGAFSDGQVKIADQDLKASHVYAAVGNYANSFKITSATTTLYAQVRVCIR